MELKNMIYRRKSCRSYTGASVAPEMLEQIKMVELKPLYPHIKIHWEIVPREWVKCICPWTTPQLITIYSEETEGYLENVGFVFQQLDLYLQSIGLGVCWLGMGRMNPQVADEQQNKDGMKFVIMLAFGHPKGAALRSESREFKRKSAEEIADRADQHLEPARLAPSSVNSQPWYFTHDEDAIHAYCSQQGILKNRAMSEMNRIDMGIALAHMYVANAVSFRFFKDGNATPRKGYGYIGSFTI